MSMQLRKQHWLQLRNKSVYAIIANNLLATNFMRRYFVSLIILIVGSLDLAGQSNLLTGFIIDNENDTIPGLIELRTSEKDFLSCVFQKDGATQEYQPSELIGFGTENGRYFASGVEKDLFVEALVIGTMSLYRSQFDFFVSKNGQTRALRSKRIEVESNGNETVVEDKKWRGVLSYLVSDCFSDANKITRSMNLSEKHLTQLAIKYNTCKESNFQVFKEDLEFTKIEVGFSVGHASSTLQIHHFTPDAFTHLPHSYKSSDLSFGLVLDVSSPRISPKIAFQGEAHLIKASFYEQVINGPSFAPVTHDTYIDLTTLSLPFSIRHYLHQKAGFYFQAGLNTDINLNRDTKYIRVGLGPRRERQAFRINAAQLGYWGGLGIKGKVGGLQTAFSARYFQVTHLNSSRGFRGKNSRLVFGVTIFK